MNDREFETDTAIVLIDGQPANTADLKLGQNVIVTGVVDSELPIGTASEIRVRTAVAGIVSFIDDDEQQLIVLGKTVLTDPDTVIDALSNTGKFSALSTANHVSINGLKLSNGDLLATRIEEHTAAGENQIAGKINNLAGLSFEVDEAVVNASSAQLIGFPRGLLVEDSNVFVRSSITGPNGELIASSVERIPAINSIENDVGELEGLISNFSTSSSFSIGDVAITSNEQTVLIGGGAANLTTNTNVIVRGSFNSTGMLIANEIEIRGTRIRLSGQVQNLSGPSFTVLGIPLQALPGARTDDKSDADVENFTLADLSVGDFVEVRTKSNPPATLPVDVERIDRTENEQTVKLRGFVSLVGGHSIQVLGASVYTDGHSRFRDAEGERISAATFYDSVSTGTFVKIRGLESSQSNVVATRISLRLDN